MTTGVFVGGAWMLTQAPESSQSLALRDSSRLGWPGSVPAHVAITTRRGTFQSLGRVHLWLTARGLGGECAAWGPGAPGTWPCHCVPGKVTGAHRAPVLCIVG